jgi:OFA family oxalate/formate antiporter-like MFS transporter
MESLSPSKNYRVLLIFFSCLLITFCMGSIHAFSTLIENIELQINVGRMESSLIYSTGLICVTVAVYLGHTIYRKLSQSLLITLMAVFPLIGVLIINSNSWIGWIIGYGFFFGFSSGLGYGFSLYAVSSIISSKNLGLALGAISASYAFGAVIFSMLYPLLFSYFDFKTGYLVGVMILSILVIIGLILFRLANISLVTETKPISKNPSFTTKIIKLWLIFFLGVFAGLMIIGHAVPIISSAGGSSTVAITTISLMAFGSGIAGIYAGWLADRFGCKRPILVILIINSLALLSLLIFTSINLLLILLVLIASLYGALIAIYPTLVNQIFGSDRSTWAYGRIFTSWGFAGLVSPSLAGWLFDQYKNYNSSLLFALILSIIAGLMIWSLKYDVNNSTQKPLKSSPKKYSSRI